MLALALTLAMTLALMQPELAAASGEVAVAEAVELRRQHIEGFAFRALLDTNHL